MTWVSVTFDRGLDTLFKAFFRGRGGGWLAGSAAALPFDSAPFVVVLVEDVVRLAPPLLRCEDIVEG